MPKQLLYEDEARLKLREGFVKMANIARATLGPRGRNIILEKKAQAPLTTKDSSTVCKEIELEDAFENMGAKLANEIAEKTNDMCGDGTSTAIVLAEAIYTHGLRALLSGCNPAAVKRGLDKAADAVVERIGKIRKNISTYEDYKNVALVASHYDEKIAELVAKAVQRISKEGTISTEESKSFDSTLEFYNGYMFDKGYISAHFITNRQDLTCEYEDVYVMLTDKKIASVYDIIPLLQQIVQTGRPLLIVAEDVEGDALATLVVNKIQGILRVVAVKAPAFGDRRKAMLHDMAIFTGGYVISEDVGLKIEDVKLSHLGRAKKIIVEKEQTLIIEGGGDRKKIEARADEIRAMIKRSTSEYDREKLQERLAKILAEIATIKVGGATEAEMKERKARAEDAVNSTRAAIEEGVVPGGGIAYLYGAKAIDDLRLLEDEMIGANILKTALQAPLINIVRNAGQDPSIILYEVSERVPETGFDVRTSRYVNMFQEGIVDAFKVVKTAIYNSISIAGLMLTSKSLITELKEEEKKSS